jgi:hypothetical protein
MQQIDAAVAFLPTNNEEASHTPDSHRRKNAGKQHSRLHMDGFITRGGITPVNSWSTDRLQFRRHMILTMPI